MSQTLETFVGKALRTLSVADLILQCHNLTWRLDVAMSTQRRLIQQRDHFQSSLPLFFKERVTNYMRTFTDEGCPNVAVCHVQQNVYSSELHNVHV